MTNKKSTKRALLSSALALVMCISMLIGSTFAWFTDSVTSSGNIIQSGSLKVTMEWLNGKDDPTATDAAWKDASEGAIFNSKLWEPGYTEVRHIKIENEGTLALKYKLNIVANGEVSDLADVIDVYYIDPATGAITDRTQLTDDKKIGTLKAVLDNLESTGNGVLVPEGKEGDGYKSVETITIALKMQESAGNEYQEKAIGSDFAIQLLATQYTYEEDSFDNQYDKDATYPVANAEELTTYISEGKSVELLNDISLINESIVVDDASANVTINLAGNNLSMTVDPTTAEGPSYIEATAGVLNLVNTSDEAVSIELGEYTGIQISNDATLNIEGVDIAVQSVESNLLICDNATVNMNEGKITANEGSAIDVEGSNAVFNMYSGEIVVNAGNGALNYGIDASASSNASKIINLYGGKISVVGPYAVGLNAYKAGSVYISDEFVFEVNTSNPATYAIAINKYGTKPMLTGNIPDSILEN